MSLHLQEKQDDFEKLNKILTNHAYDANILPKSLREFIKCNQNPDTSSNYVSEQLDPFDQLLVVGSIHSKDSNITYLIMKVLKIIMRKELNRRQTNRELLEYILAGLSDVQNEDIACEVANIILNICFSSYNVLLVIQSGIVPHLLNLLKTNRTSLQAAVAGAIQSICYNSEGKRSVIEADGINLLAPLALSENATVTLRIIGSLHNLSSDYFIAIKLRETGIIKPLVRILKERNTQPSLIASCAGCIQNLSREDESRKMIRDEGGVEPLVSLLFSEDTFTQKCAAAALLNIVGTEISDMPDDPGRKAFKEILSSCIAVGSIYYALYSKDARQVSEKVWKELQA